MKKIGLLRRTAGAPVEDLRELFRACAHQVSCYEKKRDRCDSGTGSPNLRRETRRDFRADVYEHIRSLPDVDISCMPHFIGFYGHPRMVAASGVFSSRIV